jgi:hypothetical protein
MASASPNGMKGLLWVLLVGCTGGGASDPGELTAFSMTESGFIPCDPGTPWCGYDGVVTGDHVELTSRTGGNITSGGTLTAQGLVELEAAVSGVPSTVELEIIACDDAPTFTITIDYAAAGPRTFTYDCEPRQLEPLHRFLGGVRQRLIACTQNQPSSDLVTCD